MSNMHLNGKNLFNGESVIKVSFYYLHKHDLDYVSKE